MAFSFSFNIKFIKINEYFQFFSIFILNFLEQKKFVFVIFINFCKSSIYLFRQIHRIGTPINPTDSQVFRHNVMLKYFFFFQIDFFKFTYPPLSFSYCWIKFACKFFNSSFGDLSGNSTSFRAKSNNPAKLCNKSIVCIDFWLKKRVTHHFSAKIS